MRPYLALLFIVFTYDENNRGKTLIRGLVYALSGVIVYFLVSSLFSSPAPDAIGSVVTSVFSNFELGLVKGIYATLVQVLKCVFVSIYTSIKYVFFESTTVELSGAACIYCLYYFTFILLFLLLICKMKNRRKCSLELLLIILMVIEYVAIAYLDTNYTAGNRHLTVLMLFMWYWLVNEITTNKKIHAFYVSLIIVIAIITCRYYNDSFYSWSIVDRENYAQGDINKIVIEPGKYYSNTVVWDVTDDPYLYLAFSDANAGIGINICMDSKYMDPDTIQYKYVIVSNHGDDYHKFKQSDQWTVFTSNDTYSIFEKISIN